MYNPETGRFEQGNLQDWQHAAMYSAFICSGTVDLVGHYMQPGSLPPGTEHVKLSLSSVITSADLCFCLLVPCCAFGSIAPLLFPQSHC